MSQEVEKGRRDAVEVSHAVKATEPLRRLLSRPAFVLAVVGLEIRNAKLGFEVSAMLDGEPGYIHPMVREAYLDFAELCIEQARADGFDVEEVLRE